jgi:hypothetical protein
LDTGPYDPKYDRIVTNAFYWIMGTFVALFLGSLLLAASQSFTPPIQMPNEPYYPPIRIHSDSAVEVIPPVDPSKIIGPDPKNLPVLPSLE